MSEYHFNIPISQLFSKRINKNALRSNLRGVVDNQIAMYRENWPDYMILKVAATYPDNTFDLTTPEGGHTFFRVPAIDPKAKNAHQVGNSVTVRFSKVDKNKMYIKFGLGGLGEFEVPIVPIVPIYGVWSQFEANSQRNNCGGAVSGTKINWTKTLLYTFPERTGNFFGLVVVNDPSALIGVMYARNSVSDSTYWEAIVSQYINAGDGSVFSSGEIPTTIHGGFELASRLMSNPVAIPFKVGGLDKGSRKRLFAAPLTDTAVFSSYLLEGDFADMTVKRTEYQFALGNISFAGQTMLIPNYYAVYEDGGGNTDTSPRLCDYGPSTLTGNIAGIYRKGDDETIVRAFDIDPRDLVKIPTPFVIGSSIGGNADKGHPASLDNQHWYINLHSRQILSNTKVEDIALAGRYSATPFFGAKTGLEFQKYARKLCLQTVKINTTTGAIAANHIDKIWTPADAFIDVGSSVLTNCLRFFQEIGDYPFTGGGYPKTSTGNFGTLNEILATSFLPAGQLKPGGSGPVTGDGGVTEYSNTLHYWQGPGEFGPYPSDPIAPLAGFTVFSYPDYSWFYKTGIFSFPRGFANDPILVDPPIGESTAYDDGGIDNLAAFSGYLVDDNDSGRKGDNGPSHVVNNIDGCVINAFSLPYTIYLPTRTPLIGGDDTFGGLVKDDSWINSHVAEAPVINRINWIPPEIVHVHGRRMQCKEEDLSVRWERDLTQTSTSLYFRRNIGNGSGIGDGIYHATGATSVAIPLIDNIWLYSPIGNKDSGVCFVFIDVHDLGPNFPPTTKLALLKMSDGSDVDTSQVGGSGWLELFVDNSVLDSNVTIDGRTYKAGTRRYRIIGASCRMKFGMGSVTDNPFGYIYAPQLDLLTNTVIHLYYRIAVTSDGVFTAFDIWSSTDYPDMPTSTNWDVLAMFGDSIVWLGGTSDGGVGIYKA